MTDDDREALDAFREAVNMAPAASAAWLDIDESKSIGAKSSDGGESVGHASGRRIV